MYIMHSHLCAFMQSHLCAFICVLCTQYVQLLKITFKHVNSYSVNIFIPPLCNMLKKE